MTVWEITEMMFTIFNDGIRYCIECRKLWAKMKYITILDRKKKIIIKIKNKIKVVGESKMILIIYIKKALLKSNKIMQNHDQKIFLYLYK